MALNSLAPTYGIWLVSLWIATMLYGVGVLQTWLYFHWYSNDHWGVKLTLLYSWLYQVIFLLLSETLQISCLFGATYEAFVNNFGDESAIFFVSCSCLLLLFKLNKKQKAIVLAFTQIGAGLTQAIKAAIIGSLLEVDAIKTVIIFQSAATLACDAVITLALYFALRSKRSEMKRTNTLLQKLMLNGINRGALTTAAAAVNIILFLALPGTLYFILCLLTSSKSCLQREKVLCVCSILDNT
ncbi:hypothetical protein BDP27DRAFT_1366343 [Rhodocollybia butyracea]|uniref:DUF6534 domain-containing protein n=1 Tax=Rhodocollybia butyracea TaxID=206335 RepID=A0A9P5U4F3_9AGAR|nr:hypothetical protein BDP27DRAFT_1366343 [Rhodocollybia butyracea]